MPTDPVKRNHLPLFLIILISLFIAWRVFPIFFGDGSTYLVYARNAAQGDFFSFNPHEFSSGATGAIWPLILAPAWWTSNPLLVVKIIGAFVTLTAVWVCYRTGREYGLSDFALGITLPLLLYPSVYGFLLYETSFCMLLLSLLLLYGRRVWQGKGGIGKLALVLMLLPATRPETTLIVLGTVALLTWKRRAYALLGLTLLPMIAYWTYSQVTLGAFSVSAVGRAFAAEEQSEVDVERYVTVFAPYFIVILGKLIDHLRHGKRFARIASSLGILFALVILYHSLSFAIGVGDSGWTFNRITDKAVIERLDSIAQPGATVLMYEMQDAYWFRADLKALSLDGVTDGKIIPYFHNLIGFLKRYQPNYVLVTMADNDRPFLINSPLHHLKDHPSKHGIIFTRILTIPHPLFDNVYAVYQLAYNLPAAQR